MRRLAALCLTLASLAAGQGPLGYVHGLVARGEYALARITLQDAVQTHPTEAWRLLAEIALIEGRLEEAARALEAARKAGLDAGPYYWLQGRLALAQGDYAKAWSALRAAVIYTGNARYALDWGLAGLVQGDAARATQGFAKAQRAGADGQAAYLEGLALLAQDPEAALERFRQAMRDLPPEHPVALEARYWAGRALERLGRVREARAVYRGLLRIDPDNALAQAALDRVGP
ncbi:tetratricopeptide repeat protein [Marinithermus hydrothermalis]|uniref:Tetratricopeptide TPR_2 repeat-containing protein n=1 Tax=Marinithermus hydrothermalis (strain DSM 14884 / JCM 11576 / T1) TaxID=869210 RepID=F2NLR8_MARHT|nr:tetratricopeptide repeat protein [Marinithermus hydrothermalis]AEB10898.1 Tetratricopeptide TPR_2 repeat-containing protein [Marinithermus hydrothermalis DSM 14884]